METVAEITEQETRAETTRDIGGKYLTFHLNNEEYGLEILKVREIIGIMDITKVPQTPEFVEGVINLRGKVIPVIDLRARFGLERTEYNEETCIIVVDVGMLMGIIVDTVQEVHDIPDSNIEPPPQLGAVVDMNFILGMGKVNDDVKILLDIDKVLNSDELVQLQHAAGE
ncbi:MAG: purine-binding chemotaxis protein CheW [Phycisphaerae bacterium]|nr:purine-binding chemotaxis protein CheW [Phycisphaerae bacterium]